MERTTAGGFAGECRVLVTNEGTHPAELWAKTTADQLVSTPDGPRQAEAVVLKRRIYATLLSTFHEVRADTSLEQVVRMAGQAMTRIKDIACGTPWELHFGAPFIIEEMRVTITRNLLTAANIAIATE